MKAPIIPVSFIAAVVLTLAGCASGPGMAVVRGQQSVDPSTLPLVCITLALENAELPMTFLRLKDLDTNEYTGFDVTALNLNHPKVLTEMKGAHRSLSMLIVHLKPGRYQADGAGFNGHGGAEFNFDFSSHHHLAFVVHPASINYVGTVDIAANWWSVDMNNRSGSTFGLLVRAEDTTQHDREWAVREVPGLASVPSVDSPLKDDPADSGTGDSARR